MAFGSRLFLSIKNHYLSPMDKLTLSKSTFIRGMQCEKSLYMHKFQKEQRDPTPASLEAIFRQGTSVGELAQELFPGGVDCTPDSYYEFFSAVERTQEEIAKGTKIIYEAAFHNDGVVAALDILVKHDDGWRAYEVKSSTSVSEVYKLDATIQYYTIVNSGIDLKDIAIVHINNQYEKNGEIDIHQLFTIASVLEPVLKILPSIPEQVERMRGILSAETIPEKEIGPHCSSPYSCDFAGHCWKHVPNYSIFDIARLNGTKKFELYQQNILLLKDIPEDYPLNHNQWMQVHCEVKNESHINRDAIRQFVEALNYPLYHLDYETFATAVPIFDRSRPYQQLVFQYSLHIEHADGSIEHREFLADHKGEDPRIQFVEQLIQDCGTTGDILVYNIAFERSKTFELMNFAPQHSAALLNIIGRFKDLMTPFQKRWYYTPKMRGSYSIKAVLPALVPELSYSDLNIQEGGTASNTFAAMVQGVFEGDVEEVRKDLLAYCGMDTWAMVKVLEKLKAIT